MEEAQLKWVDLAKERLALAVEVKKVSKLEADVTAFQKTITELCGSHQDEIKTLRGEHQIEVERLHDLHSTEIEYKDAFYEVEKVRVLSKLQPLYNGKLHEIY